MTLAETAIASVAFASPAIVASMLLPPSPITRTVLLPLASTPIGDVGPTEDEGPTVAAVPLSNVDSLAAVPQPEFAAARRRLADKTNAKRGNAMVHYTNIDIFPPNPKAERSAFANSTRVRDALVAHRDAAGNPLGGTDVDVSGRRGIRTPDFVRVKDALYR